MTSIVNAVNNKRLREEDTPPPTKRQKNRRILGSRYEVHDNIIGKGGSKKAKLTRDLQTKTTKVALIGLVTDGSFREAKFFAAQIKSNRVYKNLMTCDRMERYQGKNGNKIAFVQDYMNLGTLGGAFKGKKLTEKDVWEVVHSLLNGLKELNNLGFYHKDIKPQNIFVHRDENGQIQVKIGDFDLSESVTDSLKSECSGSPVYMSSESFTKMSEVVDKQDIWSTGVTLFEMIVNKKTPWHEQCYLNFDKNKKLTNDERNNIVLEDIKNHENKRDDWFPKQLKENPIGAIIFDMLDPSHASRPSLPEILKRFEDACKEPACKQQLIDLYLHFQQKPEPNLPPLEQEIKTQIV
jgi:serine/threonine protein kinase